MKKGEKALKYADLIRTVQELEPKQATPRRRTLF
jgi:hypothetical protein